MGNEPQRQGIVGDPIIVDTPQKVFVYGTLKKGFGNHHAYLNGARDLGEASIEGTMFHLGAFPAINLSEQFCRINGEVYEVNWDHIYKMDLLEGVGHGFYKRIQGLVAPHGVVWMYVFTQQSASKEQFIVPGGWWQGPNTPKLKWNGFGKGVEIGTFNTIMGSDELKVGAGESDFYLRRSGMDGKYKLIDKRTGSVIGSYMYLRDMAGNGSNRKPTLRLPVKAETSSSSTSVIAVPPETKKEEVKVEPTVPQIARLLGYKYKEA